MRHSKELTKAVAKQLLVQGQSNPASRLLKLVGVPDDEIDAQLHLQVGTLKGIIEIAGPSTFAAEKWPHNVLVQAAGGIESQADFDELVTALYSTVDDQSRIEAIGAVIRVLPSSLLSQSLEWIRKESAVLTNFARSIMFSAFLQRSAELRTTGIEPSTLLAEAWAVLEVYARETEWIWRINPWGRTLDMSMPGATRMALTPRWAQAWAAATIVRFSRLADLPEGHESANRTLLDILYHQLESTEEWDSRMVDGLRRVVDALALPGLTEQIGIEFAGLEARWSTQAE